MWSNIPTSEFYSAASLICYIWVVRNNNQSRDTDTTEVEKSRTGDTLSSLNPTGYRERARNTVTTLHISIFRNAVDSQRNTLPGNANVVRAASNLSRNNCATSLSFSFSTLCRRSLFLASRGTSCLRSIFEHVWRVDSTRISISYVLIFLLQLSRVQFRDFWFEDRD